MLGPTIKTITIALNIISSSRFVYVCLRIVLYGPKRIVVLILQTHIAEFYDVRFDVSVAFAQPRKRLLGLYLSCLSFRLSASNSEAAHTERFAVKFDIEVFCENLSTKSHFG
jgi:hypothetical protein